MAARSAAIRQVPEMGAVQLAQRMRALAGEGNWSELEDIAVQLRDAVMRVPEAQRREVMLAVRRATDDVAAKARHAREDVTHKLQALRTGQKATRAYTQR